MGPNYEWTLILLKNNNYFFKKNMLVNVIIISAICSGMLFKHFYVLSQEGRESRICCLKKYTQKHQ